MANDREGCILVNEIAALPREEWMPILSHWGITGGRFFESTRGALGKLDVTVVQSFSFFLADSTMRDRFMSTAAQLYPLKNYEEIASPVGVGQAYDLTHLLAMAIEKAGSTDRASIRTALENLGPYRGLVANFPRPFTPENHEALGPESAFMAKYREDGVIIPLFSAK